jgi:hypothetical protein
MLLRRLGTWIVLMQKRETTIDRPFVLSLRPVRVVKHYNLDDDPA